MGAAGRIVAVVNQKGGVGKTTTAVNLAASFAVSERATLIVDLDPQANATSAFGLAPTRHLYDALIGECVMKDILLPTELPHLDVVPAGRDLYGAEIELVGRERREHQLAKVLANVRDHYEVTWIDCPPSLGLLSVNALCAADSVLIPLQTEYYALEGLAALLETIELVRGDLNQDLAIESILLTMYDARNRLCRQVADEARRHFGGQVFRTTIPRNVRLSEAPSHGKPAILYDASSVGARAYLQLTEELLQNWSRASTSARSEGGIQ